jgi:hypothetical protein
MVAARLMARRIGMTADVIFVIVLIVVSLGIILAAARHSRREVTAAASDSSTQVDRTYDHVDQV